jgi:hypothetical protein
MHFTDDAEDGIGAAERDPIAIAELRHDLAGLLRRGESEGAEWWRQLAEGGDGRETGELHGSVLLVGERRYQKRLQKVTGQFIPPEATHLQSAEQPSAPLCRQSRRHSVKVVAGSTVSAQGEPAGSVCPKSVSCGRSDTSAVKAGKRMVGSPRR